MPGTVVGDLVRIRQTGPSSWGIVRISKKTNRRRVPNIVGMIKKMENASEVV